jgi:hypothetical protein
MKYARQFFNAALLISGLALLSGCDLFNKKAGCDSCEYKGADAKAGSGPVLVSISGKPAITQGDFDEYWAEILKMEPQAEALIPLMPNIRGETFKQFLNEKLILHWIKQEKKDQDPEFKKKMDTLRKQIERAVAAQTFQEYILSKIDKSDAAVEAFYKENRDKNQVFQQPPFAKKAGGFKAVGVKFNDEKSAKDFLAKAEKAGANFNKLAGDAKKSVDNFGGQVVNAQSRNVDQAVKAKLAEVTAAPAVILVPAGKVFWVVKATDRVNGEYANFADVKEPAKQAMLQARFPEVLTQELDKIRNDYKVDDAAAKTFFEEERKKREADMQEQMKKAQQAAPAQAAKAEATAPTVA